MGERFNKWIFCIFIILFISFIYPAGSQTAGEWVEKGIAYHKQGEYDKAIEAYNEAIAIDPNDATAWTYKGGALSVLGKYEKAIEAYNKAIDIDPNDKNVWVLKGLAFHNSGECRKAIEAYNRAIAIDPHYKEAWFGRGVAFAQLGEYNKAIEAYDQAIAIDPYYKEAWNGKGIAFSDLGEYDKADEAFDMADRLFPRFFSQLRNMAIEAFDMSDRQENDFILISGIAILIIIGIIIIEHLYESPKKRYKTWLIWLFISLFTIGTLNWILGIIVLSKGEAGIIQLIFKVAFIYITIWYGLETGMKGYLSYILGFSTLLPFMWIISIAYLFSRESPLDKQLRLNQQQWEDDCLFRWDKIPGEDNDRLIEFLTQKFGIDWIKKAQINKTHDGKTINIITDINKLSLTLDNESPVTEIIRSDVIITSDDGRTDNLNAKFAGKNKLNIYKYYYKEPTEWSFMKMPPLIPLSNNSLAIQIYGKPFEKLNDDQKKNILIHQGKTKY